MRRYFGDTQVSSVALFLQRKTRMPKAKAASGCAQRSEGPQFHRVKGTTPAPAGARGPQPVSLSPLHALRKARKKGLGGGLKVVIISKTKEQKRYLSGSNGHKYVLPASRFKSLPPGGGGTTVFQDGRPSAPTAVTRS